MFLQKYTIKKCDGRDALQASSRISVESDGREGAPCSVIFPFLHLNSSIGEIHDIILCLLDLCGLQVFVTLFCVA